VQTSGDAFSDLVLDTLRLQEAITQANRAPQHERAWFLQDTRQTLFVAGLHWMIRHDEACELLDPLPLAFLPGMPPWFCGLAHWHGQALPVLDLAQFWQLPPSVGSPDTLKHQHAAHATHEVQPDASALFKRMLLVLGQGEQAAGVYLDRLPRHLRLSDAQALPDFDPQTAAIPPAMRACVRGAYVQGKKSWLDVDVQALLQALEQALQTPQML
jgi:chemotaxis signal transduction protein